MKNLNTYFLLMLLVGFIGSCKKKDPQIQISGIIVTPTEAKNGEPVKFGIEFSPGTEVSQITSCIWDFGDGTTGMGLNAIHIYAQPKTYTVKVVVNNNSKYTATKDVMIKSDNRFSFSGVPIVGNTVRFYFLNPSSPGSTYKWDFGDGNFSTDSMPSHVYNADGKFDVSVVVNNDLSQKASYAITIFSDPLYTHLINGMRLWSGITNEYWSYDSAGTATSYNPRDSSFEISYVNPITVLAGSSNMYYNPSLSSSSVLAFTYDGSNPDGRGTVIYFNHVSDSIWIKYYYPMESSGGTGHWHPPARFATWHTQ